MEIKLPGKSFPKFYTSRGCPLFKHGKCCTVSYWKLPTIQTRLFLVEWKSPCFYLVLKNLVLNPLSHKYLKSLVFSVLCCKAYGTLALSEKLYLVHNLQLVPRTSLD